MYNSPCPRCVSRTAELFLMSTNHPWAVYTSPSVTLSLNFSVLLSSLFLLFFWNLAPSSYHDIHTVNISLSLHLFTLCVDVCFYLLHFSDQCRAHSNSVSNVCPKACPNQSRTIAKFGPTSGWKLNDCFYLHTVVHILCSQTCISTNRSNLIVANLFEKS